MTKKNPTRSKSDVNQSAIVPSSVAFYGDQIDTVTTPDGEHHIVLSRLCQPFSLDVKSQAEKIKDLAWATWGIFPVVAADGKVREQFCLSLRSVAGWLFTLNAGKVSLRHREKLVIYQRECANVLADHLEGKRVRDVDALVASRSAPIVAELRQYKAMAELAISENKALREQQTNGTIPHASADWIRDQIAIIAPMMAALGMCPKKQTLRAAKRVLQNGIARAAGWGHDKGQEIAGMPISGFPHVRAYLRAQREVVEAEAARRKREEKAAAQALMLARQGSLFGEHGANLNAVRSVS